MNRCRFLVVERGAVGGGADAAAAGVRERDPKVRQGAIEVDEERRVGLGGGRQEDGVFEQPGRGDAQLAQHGQRVGEDQRPGQVKKVPIHSFNVHRRVGSIIQHLFLFFLWKENFFLLLGACSREKNYI